jgi:hypothetical protein
LTNVCGFNDATAVIIHGQGLEEPSSLVETDLEEIVESIKGMRKAHSANPSVNFPLPAARHFEAFALWCQDSDRRGFVPESHNFDDDERDIMSERVVELKTTSDPMPTNQMSNRWPTCRTIGCSLKHSRTS